MNTYDDARTRNKTQITDDTIAGLRAGEPEAIETVQTVTIETVRSYARRRRLLSNPVCREFACEFSFGQVIDFTFENLPTLTPQILTKRIIQIVDDNTQKEFRKPANLDSFARNEALVRHELPPDLRLDRIENCRRFHLVVQTTWDRLESTHPQYHPICWRILQGAEEGPFTPSERKALATFRQMLIQASLNYARRLGPDGGAPLRRVADYLHKGIGSPRNLVRGFTDFGSFIELTDRQGDS